MSRNSRSVRAAVAALVGVVVAASAAPALLADHWVVIGHHTAHETRDLSPELPPDRMHYWGAWQWIEWRNVEGADLYFADSHTFFYDEIHVPPDNRRALGGISTNAYSGNEALALIEVGRYQNLFTIWAHMPGNGNLRVEKTANVFGPVHPGDHVQYTLRYKNTGTQPIADALLVEHLPLHTTYVSGGHPAGDSVTWKLGRLAPGQEGFVNYSVAIDEDVPDGIGRLYNVAITKRDPDPVVPPPATDDPPEETSDPTSIGLSRGDYLVCRAPAGTAEWLDAPDAAGYVPLIILDAVRGGDRVRVAAGGSVLLRHTVATGTFFLGAGAFSMAPASELAANALSEIRAEAGSAFGHDIGGIMDADEFVAVRTPHLALRVHEAQYAFADLLGTERIDVTSGDVYAVDPAGVEHHVTPGTPFTWPMGTLRSVAAAGPQIAGTAPANGESRRWNDLTVTYRFDEPVTSLGAGSRLALLTGAEVKHFEGTLDALAGDGTISRSWNAAGDELSISLGGGAASYSTTTAIDVAVSFENVAGASGTTPRILVPLRFYRTDVTDGHGNLNGSWDHLSVSHAAGQLEALQPYEVSQLGAPPVAAPEGLLAAAPVYRFRYLGAAGGPTTITLRSAAATPLPTSPEAPGGLYRLVSGAWQRVTAGFDGDAASGALDGADFTVALFARTVAPDRPVIRSITPAAAGAAAPSDPLVITIDAPWGVDRDLTQVFVNGMRAFNYDPQNETLPHWTIDEAGGVTTLTYRPVSPWIAGQCVYGQVVTASRHGGLASRRDFAFHVAYSGAADIDHDGMHDVWESANGLDTGANDRNADLDGDGFSNWTEYALGTSPRSSASTPLRVAPGVGTVGTAFELTRTGGAAKGLSIYLSPGPIGKKPKLIRAALGKWEGDTASFSVRSPLAAGVYDVYARLPKSAAARIGSVEIAGPVVDRVDPSQGAAKSKVKAIGTLFGTRRPLVFLVDPATQKRKACAVSKVTMDPVTGASTVEFTIAKVAPGTYEVLLDNRVGQAAGAFEVR